MLVDQPAGIIQLRQQCTACHDSLLHLERGASRLGDRHLLDRPFGLWGKPSKHLCAEMVERAVSPPATGKKAGAVSSMRCPWVTRLALMRDEGSTHAAPEADLEE